jgi:hypothetical protein
MMVVVLSACTDDGAASTERAPQIGTSPPRASSDPLEGEWRQTYACEDSVRTFVTNMHLISPRARRAMAETTGLSTALPGLIAYYIRDFAWGPSAGTAKRLTPQALCAGARDRTEIMRVADGQMAFGSPGGGVWAVTYELLGNHTLTMNDGGQDIVVCESFMRCTEATYRFTFEVDGNRLRFEQLGTKLQDPWAGGVPERAPFVRVA